MGFNSGFKGLNNQKPEHISMLYRTPFVQ